MEEQKSNDLIAHYFSELVYRARRVGTTITRLELAKYLEVDSSLISHWLNGNRSFSNSQLNKVMDFMARYERIVSMKELRSGLENLCNFMEEITHEEK